MSWTARRSSGVPSSSPSSRRAQASPTRPDRMWTRGQRNPRALAGLSVSRSLSGQRYGHRVRRCRIRGDSGSVECGTSGAPSKFFQPYVTQIAPNSITQTHATSRMRLCRVRPSPSDTVPAHLRGASWPGAGCTRPCARHAMHRAHKGSIFRIFILSYFGSVFIHISAELQTLVH